MLQQPLPVNQWMSPEVDGKEKVPNVLQGFESGDAYVRYQ
jgi:hypothetical protein